jgi:rare lipoprotein A
MFHNEINSEELLRQNPHFIHKQNGVASYYATKFHKRKTANGEVFDLFDFTAAHRRLPFGTIVKVKKIQNEKAVIVRINDRGPFIRNRIIDLSYAPSSFIDCRSLSDVEIEYINHNAVLDAIDSNYYIGFSICNAPIVFSTKKNIQFIDSSTN